jgi:hypothetical protein
VLIDGFTDLAEQVFSGKSPLLENALHLSPERILCVAGDIERTDHHNRDL